MRGIICNAATPRYFEGARASRALLGMLISGHGHRFECDHCYNRNSLNYVSYTGEFDPVAGFPPAGLSLAVFLSPCVLYWMPIRSCHCHLM